MVCTKETCDGAACPICKSVKCCGDCVDATKSGKGFAAQQPAKKTGKRCKKCGNAIMPKPTMKELGICTPETCGAELVCGGDCCDACEGIPPRCDADTCGEKMDCFGKPLGEQEKPEEPADESMTMGEHVCQKSTCGNILPRGGEGQPKGDAEKKPSFCCNMCKKPIATVCDPKTCGESEEFVCDDCRRGCCGRMGSNGKCGTCGIVGGGNRSCGDCGGGPGGQIVGDVICGKTVCGKEVECVECGGGVLCKDEVVCGSGGGGSGSGSGGKREEDAKQDKPRCKKCLKKRLLAADCTKKTCPVCSGKPREDGKVPTCCKKCVRQESQEDLDRKISASEIPPNIKRLMKSGWHPDDPMATMYGSNDDDEDAGGFKDDLDKEESEEESEVEGGKAGSNGAAVGGGDAGGHVGVIDAYCVPGSQCRNRCGVCGDCAAEKNRNNKRGEKNRNNNRGDEAADTAAEVDPDFNVTSNCDAPPLGYTCTVGKCGVTTRCHKCHGGREDRPEICPVCHPPEKSCGPGVCQVLVDCGTCCETPPDFKAAFPKLAYSGIGPFQLAVCGPIAGKIAAKKLGLECRLPSPQLEET